MRTPIDANGFSMGQDNVGQACFNSFCILSERKSSTLNGDSYPIPVRTGTDGPERVFWDAWRWRIVDYWRIGLMLAPGLSAAVADVRPAITVTRDALVMILPVARK